MANFLISLRNLGLVSRQLGSQKSATWFHALIGKSVKLQERKTKQDSPHKQSSPLLSPQYAVPDPA